MTSIKIIKQEKLPYVPFQIVFGEGILDVELKEKEITMTPFYFLAIRIFLTHVKLFQRNSVATPAFLLKTF